MAVGHHGRRDIERAAHLSVDSHRVAIGGSVTFAFTLPLAPGDEPADAIVDYEPATTPFADPCETLRDGARL